MLRHAVNLCSRLSGIHAIVCLKSAKALDPSRMMIIFFYYLLFTIHYSLLLREILSGHPWDDAFKGSFDVFQ